MKTRTQPVSSVSFVPPAINTGDPDIEKIHRMVQKAIDRSEGKTVEDGVGVRTEEAEGLLARGLLDRRRLDRLLLRGLRREQVERPVVGLLSVGSLRPTSRCPHVLRWVGSPG